MSKNEVTLREQLRKFGLKSIFGYHTILIYGMGTALESLTIFITKCKNYPILAKFHQYLSLSMS
ncbi:MAG: hypothetical protein ACFFAH_17470 [Promethearchaeota archaeon]